MKTATRFILLCAYVALSSGCDEQAPALNQTDSAADVSKRDTSTDEAGDFIEDAVITTGSAEVVRPGTTLRLDISLPPAVEAEIVGWQWSVVSPTGSVISFQPNANIKNPTFQPWVIGDYVFRLAMFDSAGRPRYAQEHRLMVAPGDGLHIELTWHTPGDPNEADTGGGGAWSAGSDVDLHLLHPLANGEWFDSTYDCHWENTNPNWNAWTVEDDPTLDRDDTDGAGPEVISLMLPEADATYRVGVHYWNDWGYGESFATIRIYIDGVLQDEWAHVRIGNRALWESHEIDQANGDVRRLTIDDGGPKITPMFPIPYNQEPSE